MIGEALFVVTLAGSVFFTLIAAVIGLSTHDFFWWYLTTFGGISGVGMVAWSALYRLWYHALFCALVFIGFVAIWVPAHLSFLSGGLL